MVVSPNKKTIETINLLETDRNSSEISLDYKKDQQKPRGDQGLRMATKKNTGSITYVTPPLSQEQLGTRRDRLRRIYPMGKSRAREPSKPHHCGCLQHLLWRLTYNDPS